MSGELHVIVRIAGERVAFPARDVDAVIEIDATTPVPRAASHVAGLAALRSRVLTVIDSRAALGLAAAQTAGEAVVLQSDGHAYALLIDGVEDAIDLAGPAAPAGSLTASPWSRVASGIVEHEGQALLVVSPALLLAGPAVAGA